jgi:hypothetical protein
MRWSRRRRCIFLAVRRPMNMMTRERRLDIMDAKNAAKQ